MEGRAADVVTSTSAVRVVNQRAVFRALQDRDSGSAADLVGVTGLSKPTVTTALSELAAVGLTDQLGVRTGNLGRAPRLYRVRPGAGAVLAIDVGRQWLRVAVVDLTGTVLARRDERSRRRSGRTLLEHVVGLGDDVLEQSATRRDGVVRTVLGGPGVHDPRDDVIRLAPNLPGWQRPGVVPELRQRLPGVLTVDNDVNLAALAELHHRRAGGREAEDFVFLSVGSGLGAGIVLGGRVVRGAHGAAGEMAALPLGEPGPDRRRRETLETLTGPAALVERAHAAGLTGATRPQDVFAAARAGSPAAVSAVRTEAERLATAVVALVAVLDPPLVVLGGGIGRHGDLLLEPVRRFVRRDLRTPAPEIVTSELGSDATLDGAVAEGLRLARDDVFDHAVGT